jgi:hypothetical protein
MHLFPKFILAWNYACFGLIVCPSSGVHSLYTQKWYVSYRFVDSFRAGLDGEISVSSWFYYEEKRYSVIRVDFQHRKQQNNIDSVIQIREDTENGIFFPCNLQSGTRHWLRQYRHRRNTETNFSTCIFCGGVYSCIFCGLMFFDLSSAFR